MIIDKYSFTIKLDDRELNLRLNFRALKNLYKLTNESPLQWLSDFLGGNDDVETVKYQCIELIYCMLDGDISLFTLGELVSTDNIIAIFNGLAKAIELELKGEIIKDKDDNYSSDDDDEEEDKIYLWNIFFNNSYYIAIYELGKSEEEFLDMSIRELKTLDYFRKEYKKNILLDAYITIQKSKNKSDERQVEKLREANAKNGIRIRDLLSK